jgi:hypothetical protein
MAVDVILTTASVGSSIFGSGTSSTRTSRLPCQVSAFTALLCPDAVTLKHSSGRQAGMDC